jgi:hypothetical protein
MKTVSKNGAYIDLNPEARPRTFRQLRSAMVINEGFDCFSKSMGEVWKITRQGVWEHVCRNIDMLTFKEYLELSKK